MAKAMSTQELEEYLYYVQLLYAVRQVKRGIKLHLDFVKKTRNRWVEFKFDIITDEKCYKMFRFNKKDLVTLVNALDFDPKQFITRQFASTPLEAIALMIFRLAHGPEYSVESGTRYFQREEGSLTSMFNYTLELFDLKIRHLVDFDERLVTPERLLKNYEAIKPFLSEGANHIIDEAQRIVGFLDGTVLFISRPSIYQESQYNGHKAHHGVNYQLIVLNDGMVLGIYFTDGASNDLGLLKESKLMETIEPLFKINDEVNYCLFGDLGYEYVKSRYIVSCSKDERDADAGSDERENYIRKASVRINVEWLFKDLKSNFRILKDPEKLGIFKNKVAQAFEASVALLNIRNILYPNQIQQRFGLKPQFKTIREYLEANNI